MLNDVSDLRTSASGTSPELVRKRLEALLPPLSDSLNAPVTAVLAGMIAGRCLPHAVIIEGGSEEYNDRAARLAARAHLCSCDSPLAGECRACRLFEAYGTHPDMYEIEGSGASGAITVDSVRDAKKRSGIIPTDASGTVFLLEHGELMQKAAQNALLKLFEEPPEGLMLILTVDSGMKLLETIRSRGTILHFEWPRGDADDTDMTAAEAWDTAQKMAAALISPTDADMLFALAPFCSGSPGATGQNTRRRLGMTLDAFEEVLRQAVIINAGAEDYIINAGVENGGGDRPVSAAAKELSASLSPDRLTRLVYELEPLRRALKNNASMPLLTAAVTERLRRAAGR